MRIWKRKKDDAVVVAEPKPLTGIEKWEMEQERQRQMAKAKAEAEILAGMRSRAVELRKELGPKLVELESLESRLQPIQVNPYQVLYYPMQAALQQQSSLASFSGLFGSLGGLGNGFAH